MTSLSFKKNYFGFFFEAEFDPVSRRFEWDISRRAEVRRSGNIRNYDAAPRQIGLPPC